jgi:predicted phosphoribosyltransferase
MAGVSDVRQNRLGDDCHGSLAGGLCRDGTVVCSVIHIGLTREGVRIGATVAAILLGAVLALDFLVRKLGKRK